MTEKKNLLLVVSTLTGGGAELVASNLCKYVNRDMFNMTICHLKERGERGDELLDAGFDVVGLPGTDLGKLNYLSFLKLRKIIQEKDIDIIHSHSTDSLIDASLCKLSLKRMKSIHTFHFGNYPNYNKKYLFLEKLFWRIPDKLVAVGNRQRKAIQETFKIPAGRIMTIWNGVEKNQANIDHEIVGRFTTENKVLIGSISTFIEQKGLTYLLDTAFQLKRRQNNFICLLVGDGPLRRELELKREKMGLNDTVFFLGWLKNAVSRVLPVFDIFFQPSLWEAMSMVVLEAMAAGLPVISTDHGCIAETVVDGVTGYLVPKRDVRMLAKKIEELISDPDLRISMGKKSRQRIETVLSEDSFIQRLGDVFREFRR